MDKADFGDADSGMSGALLLVFGLFAHSTMDHMAEVSRSFLGGEALEHAVQYFSWTNLQGALISLAIGAVLYFGVVRLLLMKKDAQGVRIYVDRCWPRWADLEKLRVPAAVKRTGLCGCFLLPYRCFLGGLDFVVALVNRLFYKKAPQSVEPKTNEQFGAYSRQAGSPWSQSVETLAYELLLYGAGVVAALLYLLLQSPPV